MLKLSILIGSAFLYLFVLCLLGISKIRMMRKQGKQNGGGKMLFIHSKSKLPSIERVEAFPEDTFGITLSNKHMIWLELADRANEPQFAELIERGIFHSPKTDGKCMYWQDGFVISLEEILRTVLQRE